MKSRCVVVIGHVDHGKTALVRALTGIETDRLPEEKQRGLSITPGFAHRVYPEGVIDFVDAPGHADFVQNMIAGASGAQAALVVISVADGIAAQTREHLNIAGFLGLSQAVIVLSKADLLSPADRSARISEVRAALSETSFAQAPMVTCSAQTGEGMDALERAMKELLLNAPENRDAFEWYLPIDRAFTLPGRGTVVTGTLLGGALTLGDQVMLQPAGRAVSIRSLESRASTRRVVHPGERMAANLRGIAAHEIPRGAVLCAADRGTASQVVDAYLDLPAAQASRLKHMQELRVLFGTSAVVAQLRLFKDRAGATHFAQLRFKKPISCFVGQKAILRRLSPAETIGGAVFLDPEAALTKSNDARRLEVLKAAHRRDTKAIAKALVAAGKGCTKYATVARLAGVPFAELRNRLDTGFLALNTEYLSTVEDVKRAKETLLKAVGQYHLEHPLKSMAPGGTIEKRGCAALLVQYVEDLAVAENLLHRKANMLALAGHDPFALLSPQQHNTLSDLEAAFRHAGLTTFTPQDDEGADLVQLLIEKGAVIPLANIALKQTITVHVDAILQAATALALAFPKPTPFTTSQARSALATSRRVIVPLLEHLDSLGVTNRQKDTRQIVDVNKVSLTPRP